MEYVDGAANDAIAKEDFPKLFARLSGVGREVAVAAALKDDVARGAEHPSVAPGLVGNAPARSCRNRIPGEEAAGRIIGLLFVSGGNNHVFAGRQINAEPPAGAAESPDSGV